MKKIKKLAFFIDNIGWGGAEKSLISLLNHLDFNNIEVDLFTVSADNDDSSVLRLIPQEVRHQSLPVCRNRLWMMLCQYCYSMKMRVLPFLGMRRHLAELFWMSLKTSYPRLKVKYDVAIAYQQGMMTYYVAEKVRAEKKIAWINSQLGAHGYDVKFNRKYYDKFDQVVAVCDTLRKILCDSGYVNPYKLTAIYDIVDENDIMKRATEEGDIDRSHLLTFVTVARLVPEKNLLLVIESANLLRNKGVDFIWYIVGEGPSETVIRKKITDLNLSDNVILTGEQSNPYKYIRSADVYVQTSTSEGFGMAIAEAKILRRPIVSTNFPIVIDQIKDRVNGLVAEMTAESVAEKIMTIISDEYLRKSIECNLSKERNRTNVTEVKKFIKLLYD